MRKIEINNIHQLIETINSYKNNFAFRGQADASWGLQSTLERFVPTQDYRRKFEDRSLEKFKSKFRLYSRDLDLPEGRLSWLSLMQHYGVPTRLLDFTESPYVALYFAIENLTPVEGGHLAIYAIDYSALVQSSCDFVLNKDRDFEIYSTKSKFFEKCEEAFEKILDRRSYDVLWFVDPTQINNRLEKQAGTFLMSGAFDKSIDNLLGSTIYSDVQIDKILIPHEFYKNIYALLRKVNLGPKNIYGDLAGLAKDIQLEMRVYNL